MEKRGKIQMMSDLMTGLNTMTEAASQLITTRNYKFTAVRDILHITKDGLADDIRAIK